MYNFEILICGILNIDSPKKAIINSKHENDEGFQFAKRFKR